MSTNLLSQTGSNTVNVANTNIDGITGIYFLIFIGDVSVISIVFGFILSNIKIVSLGDTTDGMVRLFFKPSGGAKRLLQEILIPASNRGGGGNIEGFTTTLNMNDIVLAPGDEIYATSYTSDVFAVNAFGYKIQSFSECCC